MTFQPGANVYTQGFGSRPENVEVPHIDVRAPSTTDIGGPIPFPIGKKWVDTIGNATYELTSFSTSGNVTTANWQTSSGATGALSTLTGNTGTATPTAGNIQIAGTIGQLVATAAGSTVTISLPSPVVFPGSITVPGLIQGGADINAGTTIGAGGNITSNAGNLVATNGNLVLNTAGNKLIIATGANASVGTSAAMAGTPGAVTVATTASSTTAKIFYSRATTGGTPGQVSITAQDATGFTLTSTGNETSTFNWWIINA